MQLKFPLILGSASPRRQQILKEIGFDFSVIVKNTDETIPENTPFKLAARYISEKKASSFLGEYENHIVITADTVVICEDQILGKPNDREHALEMLWMLSGKTHEVITSVSILFDKKIKSFEDVAEVTFSTLTKDEIEYYVDKWKPLDKAGAYGIQEWIGMTAISKIDGSFYTIMGLPIHKLYKELKELGVITFKETL